MKSEPRVFYPTVSWKKKVKRLTKVVCVTSARSLWKIVSKRVNSKPKRRGYVHLVTDEEKRYIFI